MFLPWLKLVRPQARGLVFAARFTLGLAAGSAVWAAGIPQTPVAPTDLALAPYNTVGEVMTNTNSPDGAYRGTGFVVGERVVLSAAHVFFSPELPGWNRGQWYWLPGANPANINRYDLGVAPRSFRVLAGYAAAVDRTVDAATQLDEFNRDTVALLFYAPVDPAGTAPLSFDALAGTGTFSLVGYPAEVGGATALYGRMYSHGPGGVAATFSAEGPAQDYTGNPMALFRSPDLITGGGQSGGPVFRLIDGEWRAVGLVLAGARDYSYMIARSLDADTHALIDGANIDTQPGIPGQLTQSLPNMALVAPVLRDDGSIVYALQGGSLHAVSATGTELWAGPVPPSEFLVKQMAESPNGDIIVLAYNLVVLDGATGAIKWSTPVTNAYAFAVGSGGEVYVQTPNRLTVISADGVPGWSVTLLGDDRISAAPPVIGPDGNIYILHNGRLLGFSPAGRATLDFATPGSDLAVGPNGTLYVLYNELNVRAVSPAGQQLWYRPYHTAHVTILADGRVLMLDGAAPDLVFLSPDGVELSRRRLNTGAYSIATDGHSMIYTSGSYYVRATTFDGEEHWSLALNNRPVYLSPANQLYIRTETALQVIRTETGATAGVWQGNGGNDQARRSANAPAVAPQVVRSPLSADGYAGFRAELKVIATGSYPLSYEWRHDGVIVQNAFGPKLVLPQASFSDSGSYTVTIRNRAGEVTSAAANLNITQAGFGRTVWQSPATTVESAPAVGANGTTYVVLSQPAAGYNLPQVSLLAIDGSGNELWRAPLEINNPEHSPPLVGDDGTIYVPGAGIVWAISPAGVLRWTKTFSTPRSGSVPYLALSPDDRLYVLHRGLLMRLRSDGTEEWSVSVPVSVQPVVRSDGTVIISGFTFVSPAGVVTHPGSGGVSLIAPGNQIVGNTSIYDSQGMLLFAPTTTLSGNVRLLTTTGDLVTDSGEILPLFGNVSHRLSKPLYPTKWVLADLGDSRILLNSSPGGLEIWKTDGTQVMSSATSGDGVLTPKGLLIGMSPVRATVIGFPPSDGPWPQASADARRTWRAPAQPVWTPPPPKSVSISGASSFYVGFPISLSAQVDGAGPFDFQWSRDGVRVAGQSSATFAIGGQTADAGRYTVKAIGPTGSVTSSAFVVSALQPTDATPGTYAGLVHDGSQNEVLRYVLVIGPDRTFQLVVVRPQGNGLSRGKLTPTGDGAIHLGPTVSFNWNGTNFSLGSGFTTETRTGVTGVAPNGLPVGLYTGGAADGSNARSAAFVFADGAIWWAHYNQSGTCQMPDDALTLEDATCHVSATADGVLRFTQSSSNHSGAFKPFAVVWTGRARQERLANLSTRGVISAASPTLISGFVTANGTRDLLLRGAGPALSPYFSDPAVLLAQPRLRLISAQGVEMKRAEAWWASVDKDLLRDTAVRVGAFPFAPAGADAALQSTLNAGAFTAILESAGASGGIALTEIYDASATAGARVMNLSTRGYAGSDAEALIGGFVIRGTAPLSLLVRAVGPGLASALGNSVVATNPRLRLYDQAGNMIASNEGWAFAPFSEEVADTAVQVGAFPLARLDAAMLLTLEPGAYTAMIDAGAARPGIALFEIYLGP
ncbi:PQQ-binding-like beta-propeller repeat protein [Horticoccus luteus]|uniref:PQQ-binding-like beta-propeller repeat protein n=1 Tax=Horticoccus luteus TaxID=2862869 RepID=A0A8F9TSW7_9BACT|nr:PQQ-binding-like beta-propeller repeat protein [Horticoccus luteus]QYM78451.1 PQQ-binding-like beta-propeller repeat protein [Horticoccus luteus]